MKDILTGNRESLDLKVTNEEGQEMWWKMFDPLYLYRCITYHCRRYSLDERIKSMLDGFENSWLGFAKVLLIGPIESEEKRTALKDQVNHSGSII